MSRQDDGSLHHLPAQAVEKDTNHVKEALQMNDIRTQLEQMP
jgi:hypothetical protein